MFLDISTPKHPNTFARIDEDDLWRVSRHKWFAIKCGKWQQVSYALASIGGKTVLLHRLIIRAEAGQIVDHINGDGLDCRKENLRVCSHGQNMANRRKRNAPTTSRFFGVYFDAAKGTYVAALRKDGKRYRRCRKSEVEAAMAYNDMAKIHHGPFASLNVL